MNVAETFADLAARLYAGPSVRGTVDEVMRCARLVTGCSEAGVALTAGRRRLQVGATTTPLVAQLFEWEIAATAGPSVVAFSAQDAVLVADTASDDRWPAWAEHAYGLGVRSIVDVPLSAARPLGVLSLLSAEPKAFDRHAVEIGHILAQHAAVAVATARNEQNLREAIDSRNLIGQAQGILMERYNLDAERAFAVLRRYSQDTNTKLSRIAQQLVESGTLPDQS